MRLSPWRHLVVVGAVGQLVSAELLTAFGSFQSERSTATTITPPGYAFAIWGLICLLCLVFAFLQSRPRPPDEATLDGLAPPLVAVFALFSLWLALAELQLLWLTVAAFAGMGVGLLRAAAVAQARPLRTRILRRVFAGLLGSYAGWTTVAVFVNASAAIRATGAPLTSPVGQLWQALLLAGAVALAALLTWRWLGPLPYVLAVLWGLVGAGVATVRAGTPALTLVCGAGVVVVLAVAAWTRRTQAARAAGRGWPWTTTNEVTARVRQT